jgi:hypothetical protein
MDVNNSIEALRAIHCTSVLAKMSVMNAFDEYEAAIKKGRRLCNDLNSFVLPDPPIRPRRMDALYHVESRPLRANAARAIQVTLEACEISTSDWVYVEVKSFIAKKRESAPYCNHVDGGNGVLVCSENIKSRDENAPDDKLWPSEILWQSWVMAAKAQGSQPSDLHAIVRSMIVNESTKRVIWRAANRSTFTRQGPDHYTEYTERDQGYHAFLGSVNGASSMRMLLDHKAALGYRTVERVMILGNKDLTLTKPEARTVVVLLSSPRFPPSRIPRPPFTTRRMIPLGTSSSESGGNIEWNPAARADAGHSVDSS